MQLVQVCVGLCTTAPSISDLWFVCLLSHYLLFFPPERGDEVSSWSTCARVRGVEATHQSVGGPDSGVESRTQSRPPALKVEEVHGTIG